MFRRCLRLCLRVTLRLVAVFIVVELILHARLWPIAPTSILEPDPITGWRVKPNLQLAFQSEGGPYLIETNSSGMRDKEHPKEKNDRVYRIVAQGACGTFGKGISERDDYVSKLEELLPSTETVNLGAVGFCPVQRFKQLTNEAIQYQPDLIVQFFIQGDENAAFYPWVAGLGWKPYLVYENGEVIIRPPTPTLLLQALEFTHLPLLASQNSSLFEPLFPEGMPSNEERFLAMALLIMKTEEFCRTAGVDYLPVFVGAPEYLQVYEHRGKEAYVLIPRVFEYLQEEQYLTPLNLMDPLLEGMKNKSTPSPFSRKGRSLEKYGHEIVGRSVAEAVKLLPRYQARTQANHPARGLAGSGS